MDDRSEIKQVIANDIDSNLSELFGRDDDVITGMYAGKVVDNVDPEKIGRCKIRVYSIFDNSIPDDDLPWAMPDGSFVGSLVGSYVMPPIGAIVRVYFDQGDIYLPHYSTKAVDRSNALSKIKKLDFDGNPDVLIFFATDEGDFFKIDKSKKMIEFRTASGDFIKVDKKGDIEISTMEASGTLSGRITVNAKGDVTVNSEGDITTNSINAEVNADLDVTVNSTTANINATIKATINSPIVEIPHKTLGTVTPDPATGGPFNCLMYDPVTGAPHQGWIAINA